MTTDIGALAERAAIQRFGVHPGDAEDAAMGFVAGYLRGHVEGRAPLVALAAPLVEALRRLDCCDECPGPDGGQPLCADCEVQFYEAIELANDLRAALADEPTPEAPNGK